MLIMTEMMMTPDIGRMFAPLVMERVVSALRYILNAPTATITKWGTYAGKNVIMGFVGTMDSPFVIYLNTTPSIYFGEIKQRWFPRRHYVIDKLANPPLDLDGRYIRLEECLPEHFGLMGELNDVMMVTPTNDAKPIHLAKWNRLTISSAELAAKGEAIKNLWAWTYEIDMNEISGTNVIYLRSKSDLQELQNVI